MAVVTRRDPGRRGAGRTFGFGRFRGLGDAASDAWLGSSQGAAALAAAQAAAAKLPAGFTMGDPTSDLWGASYYNGKKIIGSGPSYTGTGPNVWFLEDNSEGPAYSDTTMQLIQAAANAAYGVYSYIEEIRTASPAMAAVLTDPEWIALQGGGPIDFTTLSSELQTKIKAVPDLYNTLIGNFAAVTPYVPPPAPSGPARYLVGGIEFLEDGTVISVNGTPVSGVTLTPAEVQSLVTTGALPAGDTGPAAPAPTTTITYVPGSPAAIAAATPAPAPVAAGSDGSSSPINFTAANDVPSGGGGIPSFVASTPTSAPVAAVETASSSNGKWWLVAAGVAALAFTVTRSQPSRRSRRRR